LETILYIALCIPLVPAILASFKWKYLTETQRWFSIMLWGIVIISFFGELWLRTSHDSNLPFFHVYILMEYVFLLNIFRTMFKESVKDFIWLILVIGFSLIWTINIFTGVGWWAFPDYIHVLEAIIIIGLVISWFSKMLNEKIISRPERTFEFWICAGLLLFFSGNFLLFIFSKFIILTIETAAYEAIWKIHCILIILLYLLYTLALLWVKKPIK